jgi:hypothetical protein
MAAFQGHQHSHPINHEPMTWHAIILGGDAARLTTFLAKPSISSQSNTRDAAL